MNKDSIIQKLNLITNEMQQQTIKWTQLDSVITPLELEAFLSNIRYLIEQAEILNTLLANELVSKETVLPIESPKEEVIKSTDELMVEIDEKQQKHVDIVENASFLESKVLNEKLKTDQKSLNDRLSENIQNQSFAEKLKSQTVQKDFSFSLNERFFVINNLFNGDSNNFSEMITYLNTFRVWIDAEAYLREKYFEKYEWAKKTEAYHYFLELLKTRFNE